MTDQSYPVHVKIQIGHEPGARSEIALSLPQRAPAGIASVIVLLAVRNALIEQVQD
jgi:hypothetical protein